MKQFLAAGAAGAALLLQAPVHSAEPVRPPLPFHIQHSAHAIMICENAGGKRCVEIAMPEEAGKIERAIQGNFLDRSLVPVSWIALANKHASMCTVVPGMPVVVCTPIGQYPKDMKIFARNRNNGVGLCFGALSEGQKLTQEHHHAAKKFSTATFAAVAVLHEFLVRSSQPGEVGASRATGIQATQPLAFSARLHVQGEGAGQRDAGTRWWHPYDEQSTDFDAVPTLDEDDGFRYPGWATPNGA